LKLEHAQPRFSLTALLLAVGAISILITAIVVAARAKKNAILSARHAVGQRLVEEFGGSYVLNSDGSETVSVDLSNCMISDSDMKTLFDGTDYLDNIETLDLSRTPITDAGLVYLNSLFRMRNLNLYNTNTTRIGQCALQRSLPHCEIRCRE